MYDQLSDYDFDLPENLIAQQPADPRDPADCLMLHQANMQTVSCVICPQYCALMMCWL